MQTKMISFFDPLSTFSGCQALAFLNSAVQTDISHAGEEARKLYEQNNLPVLREMHDRLYLQDLNRLLAQIKRHNAPKKYRKARSNADYGSLKINYFVLHHLRTIQIYTVGLILMKHLPSLNKPTIIQTLSGLIQSVHFYTNVVCVNTAVFEIIDDLDKLDPDRMNPVWDALLKMLRQEQPCSKFISILEYLLQP